MSVTQIAISRLNKGAQALCTKETLTFPLSSENVSINRSRLE